jgi:hypothetical protein
MFEKLKRAYKRVGSRYRRVFEVKELADYGLIDPGERYDLELDISTPWPGATLPQKDEVPGLTGEEVIERLTNFFAGVVYGNTEEGGKKQWRGPLRSVNGRRRAISVRKLRCDTTPVIELEARIDGLETFYTYRARVKEMSEEAQKSSAEPAVSHS